jgi:cysteinyl-tRNA synthetase
VLRLVEERGQARARRDWKRADQLRDEIQRLGWNVEDTPGGPRVTRKSA